MVSIEADRTPHPEPRPPPVSATQTAGSCCYIRRCRLPLPHLDTSLAEPGRALDDLGMASVAMTTTILGQSLIDSRAGRRHHLGDALLVKAVRLGHSGFVLTVPRVDDDTPRRHGSSR